MGLGFTGSGCFDCGFSGCSDDWGLGSAVVVVVVGEVGESAIDGELAAESMVVLVLDLNLSLSLSGNFSTLSL